MAEYVESSATTETKQVVSPRVVIDTSPPIESVKEAVDRFGGSGPWLPHHLLRLAAAGHHETGVFDVAKIEQEATQLERDLIMKQQQTLNVLKELEATKKFVEGLKVNMMLESPSFFTTRDPKLENHDDLSLCSVLSPGLMFVELNQAKLNLNKTSGDLAVIQASVESLNKKMTIDKLIQMQNSEGMLSLEQINRMKPEVDEKVNFEAEQFKKMTEASRYEIIKAMTEIERTKNSIKMAEMRLNAAKKMEEAAKAVEAIALTQSKDLLTDENSSDEITLSFEEYRALTRKAQQAQDLCKTKFMDTDEPHGPEEPILEKFEEKVAKENIQSRQMNSFDEEGLVRKCENNLNKYKFRNSHPCPGNEPYTTKQKSPSGFRSIGDILSRKLMLQDEVVVENRSEREHISLSQMLQEQSRLILHPPKPTADGSVEKQYFVHKKRFGFIQVPLPTKQSKKKTQPLNMR
ncbi:hypothetical protein CDL12_06830 [Handroanthus impetiginosus]|uniref:WEB family protein n=1 Tax=Handroanthus impetiginosus TaxID=429701 RepID=A0A2G9HSQ5_9LAMI|nr:hypothetical protein CDL12_06830 [Handroanthus impetiginosus]